MAESPINSGQPPIDADPNTLLPDEEMLKLVVERWHAARDWRKGKEKQWKRWYQLYRSYAEQKDWPHAVSLFIPLIWSTVESFLPRLVTQKPTIIVEARGDEKIEAAAYHRQLLEYQWAALKIPMVLIEWMKECLIYGTAVVKVGWEKETAVRTFNRKVEGQDGVVQDTIEDFVIKDDPFVALVAIENFYPEPGSATIPHARYVIERRKMDFYQIRAEAEANGWNMARVKELEDKKLTSSDPAGEDTLRTEKESTFGGSDSKQAKNRAQIFEFEVLEYWENGRYAIVVTEPEIILVNDLNPFWHGQKPYLRIIDNALPGEFYGVGEPEVLESINIELNEMHNLRLEADKRSVFQTFKVRLGSPVTPAMTEFKQQGIIWVNQQDDIEPLFSPGPGPNTVRAEDSLRTWAQITTGANDNFQGIESNLQQETATGASILAQAAASRVGLKFLQFSQLGLEPMGTMLIALNEQHIDTERAMRIIGPEGALHEKLTPADLATNGALMDVKIDIGATDPVSRELKLKKTMEFLQIMMQLFGDPNHPAIQVLIKRITDLAEIPMDQELLAIPPNPATVAASGGTATPPAPKADNPGASIADATAAAPQGP